MGLIRTLLWFGLFLVSTFAFTVLFEYGPFNFVGNSQKQFDALVKYYHARVDGPPAKKP